MDEGFALGCDDGDNEGIKLGFILGIALGSNDGSELGLRDGFALGIELGSNDGSDDGLDEGIALVRYLELLKVRLMEKRLAYLMALKMGEMMVLLTEVCWVLMKGLMKAS